MTETNPFKAGSRKAKIYDVFKAKGLEAAFKEAEKLQIKPGTVKSWSGSWTKGTVPAKKAKGEKAAKVAKPGKRSSGDETYEANFKYLSRHHAESNLTHICERSGLRPHAFHVLENEGKFAVVPISYRPIGPVPQFEKGDVVFDVYVANSKARVIEPGPEQTMIKYDKESTIPGHARPREDCVLNRYLVKLPDEPLKGKGVKREKIEPDNAKLQKAAKDSGAFEFKERSEKKELRKEVAKLVTPKGKVKKTKREKL